MEAQGTLLLVDDEVDIRETVARLLGRRLARVEVLQAGSGPEALDLLQDHAVDLILTDFRMPGMDGLAFLERARAMQDVPRILFTAYPDVEIAVKALNDEHVSYFLVKPVEADKLVRAVADALDAERRAQLRDEALQEAERLVQDLWRELGDRGGAP